MFKYLEPNKIFSVTSKAPKYVLLLFVVVLSIGLSEALIFSPEDLDTEHINRIIDFVKTNGVSIQRIIK